jgi:hypothetical protein
MMNLRELLIERILFAMTEAELLEHQLTADQLEDLADVDLFELYEEHVFQGLLK